MIDAHHHYWRIGRNDCVWPTRELRAIYRDFGPEDFEPLARSSGVAGSVLVQSQPSDRDTDYIVDLAEARESVRGVVVWVDLARPDARARIETLARRPKVRGVRPMLQDLEDDAWIADVRLDGAIDALVDNALSLDALVYTRHLPHVHTLARRRPDLPIVVDHAAKPPLASGRLEAWRTEIARLADCPNVSCKISGLLTEAAPGQAESDFQAVVSWVLDSFSPARVMWGSDWPVVNLAGDYAGWLGLARRLAATAGADEDAVFGGTASRFYRLSPE